MNYIFILLLIILSGTNIIYGFEIGYLFPFILYFYYTQRGLEIKLKEVFFLFLFFILILLQNFLFSNNWKSDSLTLLFYLSCFLISKLVYKNFKIQFVKIIYYLCLSSLIIWFFLQVSDDFKDALINFSKALPHYSSNEIFFNTHKDLEITSYNLYIFNVNAFSNYRNNGIFYEPGRFAIYICIAMAINLFSLQESLFSKKNILFLIALVTTFSTSGYIALFLIFLILIIKSKKNIFFKIFSLLVFFGTIKYISELDFMTTKIVDQINDSENSSRFTSVLYHLNYIEKSPWIGFGNYSPTLELSPNGLSLFILKFGFLFFFVYLYFLYSGAKFLISDGQLISKYIIIIVFLMLLTLGFSQTITTEPFYITIMFMGLILLSKKKVNL